MVDGIWWEDAGRRSTTCGESEKRDRQRGAGAQRPVTVTVDGASGSRPVYSKRKRTDGHALPDNVSFVVDHPIGARSAGCRVCHAAGLRQLVDGAPVFAVEVRSPEDFGPAARAMAENVPTILPPALVVWDARSGSLVRALRERSSHADDVSSWQRRRRTRPAGRWRGRFVPD